jgi:DUF2075 family protein
MLEPADAAQLTAWRNCFAVLRVRLAALADEQPESADWTIVFEYELPRERGRRPDVVLLTGAAILVLEFKDFSNILQAHVDQVAAYARDLQHYQAASHDHPVHAVLVLTRAAAIYAAEDGIQVVSPAQLPGVLRRLTRARADTPIDPVAWLHADYAPLPSLVSAARAIFQHEPLPDIRRAQSAGIPETIAHLVAIAEDARQNAGLHLALVTGVPGAGKTLVGLQFVYENHFHQTEGERAAVFLSGNGPLVRVLQYALKSSVFVQDVHGFLKQYGGNQQRRPEERIWVYDEAQRAWDADQVQQKRGHYASEPEDFLRIGERMGSWAMMVGLIGEGQEIHLGEEAGLAQWNAALAAMSRPWRVHCPTKIAPLFTAAATVMADDTLDLTTSLRSHLAEDVQQWVSQVLDGHLAHAAHTAARIAKQRFNMYITRDLEAAKNYVRQRYLGQEDKRYGLLASSKAKNVADQGIMNQFNYTRSLREGPWYNDPPSSPRSCCQLHDVATEFACQGLELDFPIVAWGNDLTWRGDAWQSPPQPRSHARNPHMLRVNSYRVLLSRGRDGFVVFVPDEQAMTATYEALVSAGLRELQGAVQVAIRAVAERAEKYSVD